MAQKKPKLIASFECSISTAKSGILVGGDGAQVKVEIPGTETAEIIKLIAYGQHKILKVDVYEAQE